LHYRADSPSASTLTSRGGKRTSERFSNIELLEMNDV